MRSIRTSLVVMRMKMKRMTMKTIGDQTMPRRNPMKKTADPNQRKRLRNASKLEALFP